MLQVILMSHFLLQYFLNLESSRKTLKYFLKDGVKLIGEHDQILQQKKTGKQSLKTKFSIIRKILLYGKCGSADVSF